MGRQTASERAASTRSFSGSGSISVSDSPYAKRQEEELIGDASTRSRKDSTEQQESIDFGQHYPSQPSSHIAAAVASHMPIPHTYLTGGENDTGWGCLYRCIQMLISVNHQTPVPPVAVLTSNWGLPWGHPLDVRAVPGMLALYGKGCPAMHIRQYKGEDCLAS
eukprot:3023575-Amphidinium_carterae.1